MNAMMSLRAAAICCAVQWLPWACAPAWAQPARAAFNDVAYGADPAQKADIYLPAQAKRAPILVVVHGGAWRFGDKASPAEIEQKAAYWIPKGFIVVSVNYRLLPAARPEQQAQDLGRALAWVQRHAATWGGDPKRVFLMGHSSGGQMVALLAADREMQLKTGAKPWLASIVLDGAGLDMLDVMSRSHARFYDDAFGADRTEWIAASPAEHLRSNMPPMLMICSTLRAESCRRANSFSEKLAQRGNSAKIFGVPRNHGEIDSDVGGDNDETRAIAAFMKEYLAL
jgi:arylformamidase